MELCKRHHCSMNDDGPSRTALGAATHRAAHQVLDGAQIFPDRLAIPILPDARSAIEEARAHPEHRRLRLFIAGRHRVFEDLAQRQSIIGPTEVVLLGAGLDTFGYRHADMPDLRVWEIDHPASQDWKRTRLVEAGISVPGTSTLSASTSKPTTSPQNWTAPASIERAGWCSAGSESCRT